MKTKPLLFFSVACGFIVVLAWRLHSSGNNENIPIEVGTASAVIPNSSQSGIQIKNNNIVDGGSHRNARQVARVISPLPPENVPLPTIATDLHARAVNGDFRAACRISFELGRCNDLSKQRAALDAMISKAEPLSSSTPEQRENVIAQTKDEVDKTISICNGLSTKGLLRPWQYLLSAAQAGHVPSMLRFATNPPIDETNFARDLEGWSVYKENALPLLEAALKKGEPMAATHLAWFYSGFPVAGGSVVDKDSFQAIRYTQTALRMANAKSKVSLEKRLARISIGVDVGEVQRAKDSGDDLYLKTFADKKDVAFSATLYKDNGADCQD
ncbi:MAG: hypothetical protein JNN20_16205 [Betaproteobacteria bacterium]|nr:hypothetical protein [Betaproteobacteria bacterium]